MVDRTLVEITRVAAADDRTRYDGLSIALHWATAALVVALYALAKIWGFLPRGTAERHMLQSLHVSLGLCLTAVLITRLIWRIGPGAKLQPAYTGIAELAAKAVQYLLYLLLAAEAVLGWCYRWASNDPLSFFGLFTIAAPFDFTREQQHTIGSLHGLNANIILVVAGLHAAAALFHHHVLRDDVLWRMLPGRRARAAAAQAPDPRSVS